jgi:hypothetical protein
MNELHGIPTAMHASTTVIPLFIYWMTWVKAFMRDALVMAFMRAFYHFWQWNIMSLCKRPMADNSSEWGGAAICKSKY